MGLHRVAGRFLHVTFIYATDPLHRRDICSSALATYVYLVSEPNIFLISGGGTLGTAATTRLLYQPRMKGEGDCGEIGGMKSGKRNRSTRRTPAPAPLCPS
jgi:hypothetical protein